MYATNGVSAFFVYSVGPATALIAGDLGISPQSAALHGTSIAAAMLTAGAIASPIIARRGRLSAVSTGLVGMSLGVLAILVAPVLAVSLLGAYLAGVGGGVSMIAANATLSVAHAETAATVLTEANAAAAWVGLFSPLLMGMFLAVGLGWRWGLALAIPLCLTAAWAVRKLVAARSSDPVHASPLTPAPAVAAARPDRSRALPADPMAGDTPRPSSRGFPPAIWVVMIAVAATAGAEFGVGYWGATLIAENTGAAAGTATAAMSAPVAGVAVGRTLGAPLSLRAPAHPLLVGGWVVALLGFATFWRAGLLPIAVLGLFVTGLGLSLTYPLLLDRAVLLMPDRADRAISLAAPFVGVAIGLAPFVLGALAGQVGVGAAFLVVPTLLVIGLVAVLATRPKVAVG
jgi:MFS family permease